MPDLLQQLSDHPPSTLWSCGATVDSARRLGFLPGLGILTTDDL